jgi:hypothetical protein
MNEHTHHEVISAFMDGEPFDAHELGTALATPEGREMLLDLTALGHVITEDPATESMSGVATKRTPWRALAAAAAIVLALGGGYLAGHRAASDSPIETARRAPAPTRVIEVNTWQQVEGER